MVQKKNDELIIKCQQIITENSYIDALLLHDEIVDTYFKNDKKVLMKLSTSKYFLGLLDELDYINDLKILVIELNKINDRSHNKANSNRNIFTIIK